MNVDKSQRGITLAELLISMAITVVITGALIAGIYTIISVSGRGNDELEALHDIQNATYWITNDIQMAGQANLESGDNITLTWNDRYDSPHSVSFTLVGSELIRNYDSEIMMIANNVSFVEFTVDHDLVEYTITSTPPGRWNVSETISGQVTMRAYQ